MTHKAICGDKSLFAIECRVDFESETPARNAIGEITFWIGGRNVGNSGVISTIGIAGADLEATLRWCGGREDLHYYSASRDEVVESVLHYVYEVESSNPLFSERGERFLACMTASGNEWTDGWLFVLVEGRRTARMAIDPSLPDRFLYRDPNRVINEFWLPSGEYGRVVEEFLQWLCQNSTFKRWRDPK